MVKKKNPLGIFYAKLAKYWSAILSVKLSYFNIVKYCGPSIVSSIFTKCIDIITLLKWPNLYPIYKSTWYSAVALNAGVCYFFKKPFFVPLPPKIRWWFCPLGDTFPLIRQCQHLQRYQYCLTPRKWKGLLEKALTEWLRTKINLFPFPVCEHPQIRYKEERSSLWHSALLNKCKSSPCYVTADLPI